MTTIYYNIEDSPLLQENEGMLDAILMDKYIFTLQHQAWYDQYQLLRKFWRS